MPVKQSHELAAVVASLLGPPVGRRGERGGRSWWICPLHDDRNPSFTIDPEKGSWKCYGCGERGDDASLVMKLRGVGFREARAELMGGASAPIAPRPRQAPKPRQDAPSGLPAAEALSLVEEAEARLWGPGGATAMGWLTSKGPTPLGEGRCLDSGTIKAARLGWTPGSRVPTRAGGSYRARGIAIPWFDGDRLAKLIIRQPDGENPKYAEAFRDSPAIYPGRGAIRPGLDLILVEGEFECIVVGQAVGDRAAVITLGSASGGPDPELPYALTVAPRIYLATDGDGAGDRAAGRGWPARARRVRPPGPLKDWTEFVRHGADLARWWGQVLDGPDRPPLFTGEELSAWRWGPAIGDPGPGIIRD